MNIDGEGQRSSRVGQRYRPSPPMQTSAIKRPAQTAHGIDPGVDDGAAVPSLSTCRSLSALAIMYLTMKRVRTLTVCCMVTLCPVH